MIETIVTDVPFILMSSEWQRDFVKRAAEGTPITWDFLGYKQRIPQPVAEDAIRLWNDYSALPKGDIYAHEIPKSVVRLHWMDCKSSTRKKLDKKPKRTT